MKRIFITALLALTALVGYLALTATPTALSEELYTRAWTPGPVLDQGQEPACVGYAWVALLQAEPRPDADAPDPYWLYKETQKVDQWSGEDYGGTSPDAAADLLVQLGYLQGWKWTYDITDIRDFVLSSGPIILVFDWHASMYTVTSSGYALVYGPRQENHAVMCYEWEGPYLGCQNSWGMSYGQGGTFKLSNQDLSALLDEGGWAILPTKQYDLFGHGPDALWLNGLLAQGTRRVSQLAR